MFTSLSLSVPLSLSHTLTVSPSFTLIPLSPPPLSPSIVFSHSPSFTLLHSLSLNLLSLPHSLLLYSSPLSPLTPPLPSLTLLTPFSLTLLSLPHILILSFSPSIVSSHSHSSSLYSIPSLYLGSLSPLSTLFPPHSPPFVSSHSPLYSSLILLSLSRSSISPFLTPLVLFLLGVTLSGSTSLYKSKYIRFLSLFLFYNVLLLTDDRAHIHTIVSYIHKKAHS